MITSFNMEQEMCLFLLPLLAALLCQHPFFLLAQSHGFGPKIPTSHITVQGSVFCDPCHNNTFSRHSYFLPGVEVHIQCKLSANSAVTNEEIAFSVNRTTNRFGIYKLDIPNVEGVECTLQPDVQAFCEVTLKGASSFTCNIPGLNSTTNKITLKAKRNNHCIYSMSALSYRPQARNATICGETETSFGPEEFNSSKTFFPFWPPYFTFPWPQLPPLPSLPPLPPLPALPPLPPLPSWPWPFAPLPPSSSSLPPLPPLPSLPPLPPLPSLPPWTFPKPPSPPFTFPPLPNFPSPPAPPNNDAGDVIIPQPQQP